MSAAPKVGDTVYAVTLSGKLVAIKTTLEDTDMSFKDIHEYRDYSSSFHARTGPNEAAVMVAIHKACTGGASIPYQFSIRLSHQFVHSALRWGPNTLLNASYDDDSNIMRLEVNEYGRLRVVKTQANKAHSPYRIRFLIGRLPFRHASIHQVETLFEIRENGVLYVDVPDLLLETPEPEDEVIQVPVRPVLPHWRKRG